jgi:N-acetylmuramoyl-L-alanine amidase
MDHKYILIHFTTGTRMESTIHYVQRADAGGCAHLLIGREGRVVQFVPFNKVAYHAGFSWWECDTDLNHFSIGIELDNAGSLTGEPGNWMHNNEKISDEDVEIKTYWRDLTRQPSAWQKFTLVQLDVLEKILEALVAHYGGPEHIEILGHDDVNLVYRIDPGPVFPMEAIREKLLGRRLPRVKEYHLAKDASLYTHESTVPDVNLLKAAVMLPKGAQVKVVRVEEKWSLVNVIKSNNGTKGRGWLLTRTVTSAPGSKKITNASQLFYPKFESPPCLKVTLPSFTEDQRIRIEEVRGAWSLIVMLDHFGMEGWVKTKYISPDPVQG